MRHRLARAATLALALGGGAGLGEAAWQGAVAARSEAAPPGWELQESQVPYRLAALSGPLRASNSAWGLDFWRILRPQVSTGPTALAATVQLPEGGQLELWPAMDQGERSEAGVYLVLERIGAPTARVIQAGRGQRRSATCDGALPGPGEEPIDVAVLPEEGGLIVTVDKTTVRCQASVRGAGPALRPGLRRVLVSELRVGEELVPDPGPEGRDVWRAVGAGLAAVLVALELAGGARIGLVALTTLPLLLCWALAPLDLRLWAETARVAWLPSPWIAAGFPALGAASAKAAHHLGSMLRDRRRPDLVDWPLAAVIAAGLPMVLASPFLPDPAPVGLVALASFGAVGGLGLGLVGGLHRLGSPRPRRVATLVLGVGTAAGCAATASSPLGVGAVAGAVLAGCALAVILWANVNASRLRRFNSVSLTATVLLVLGLEALVRGSAVGAAWSGAGGRTAPDDIFGWVPVAQAEFAALHAAQPSTYPDSGYPIAIAPDDGRPRVVAMGGSTTGGAFQNDDLRQFYPAQLSTLLGEGVAVLNQGVGGWTTWHIRRYLDTRLPELAPDVLILYVGHNDLLTPVPMPYSALFAAWQAPDWRNRAGALLAHSRLYQGLRYAVTAFGDPQTHVAVPLPEAEDNLRQIISAVRAQGGRVLLASEGLAPDPGPLSAYNEMMAKVAREEEGTAFVDTASLLHALDGPPLFLDDCHLTGVGHGRVAVAMAEALRREDMIPDHE